MRCSKTVRAFGILTFRDPALRNVKRTYRVTAFDIGPRSPPPFKGECSKSPQGFLASRRGRSSKNKNGNLALAVGHSHFSGFGFAECQTNVQGNRV